MLSLSPYVMLIETGERIVSEIFEWFKEICIYLMAVFVITIVSVAVGGLSYALVMAVF